jgi:transposase-like protein
VAEQRYQAVLAVISDGETVTDVAGRFGVARTSVHVWLIKCEAVAEPVRGRASGSRKATRTTRLCR